MGLVLPDPGTPGVAGSGDQFDGSVLNANWTKVGKYAGPKTGQNAVGSISNNTAETTLASGLILPNPSIIGTAFRWSLWGNYDNAAVASTLTLKLYLGTGLVHTFAITTPAGAFTLQQWFLDWDAVCQTAAAGGTWESRVSGSTSASNTKTAVSDVASAAIAQTVTLPNNFLKLTAQWGVANVGHIARCRSSASYWTKAV